MITGATITGGVTFIHGVTITEGVAPPVFGSAWYSIYQNASVSGYISGRDTCVDSNHNVYFLGTDQTDVNEAIFLKTDSNGVLIWQKKLSYGVPLLGLGVNVNSNDEIIIVALTDNNKLLIIKIDSDCNIIWRLETNNVFLGLGTVKIGSDNSINILSAKTGTLSPPPPQRWPHLLKISDDGDLLFNMVLIGSNATGQLNFYGSPSGLHLDSDNNIVLNGNTSVVASQKSYVMIQISNTGAFMSGIVGAVGTSSSDQYSISDTAVDIDGNYYIAGGLADFAGTGGILFKMDSSGGLLWTRIIDSGAPFRTVRIDGDYIYAIGQNTNYGYYSIFVVKFDLDGNIIWQRSWSSTYDDNVYGHNSIAFNGDFYTFTGDMVYDDYNYYTNMVNVQLPKDGSLTGTYGDFTYYDPSYSIRTTNTMTFFSSSPSISVPAVTLATSDVSFVNLSYTYSLYPIP